MAERQGLEESRGAYRLTPQAYRLFQGKLLERIFSQLQASRTGRHPKASDSGEGAVEMQQTKPYEFGDSVWPTWTSPNRSSTPCFGERRAAVAIETEDIEIHRTRNHPKCATAGGDGHERFDAIRRAVHQRQTDGPGPGRADSQRVSRRFPAVRSKCTRLPSCDRPGEVAQLMPKPVTIHDPWVRLWRI